MNNTAVTFTRMVVAKADDARRPDDESSMQVGKGQRGELVDGDGTFSWVRIAGIVYRVPADSVVSLVAR
jgi:hypothetical protein